MPRDYMVLLGSEQVERAAHIMTGAASTMMQAASSMDHSLAQHQRYMDDWLQRLDILLKGMWPAMGSVPEEPNTSEY